MPHEMPAEFSLLFEMAPLYLILLQALIPISLLNQGIYQDKLPYVPL